jgi:hypothetical protein
MFILTEDSIQAAIGSQVFGGTIWWGEEKENPEGSLSDIYDSDDAYTRYGPDVGVRYSPLGEWFDKSCGDLNRTVESLPYEVFAFLLYSEIHENIHSYVQKYRNQIDDLIGSRWVMFVIKSAEDMIINPTWRYIKWEELHDKKKTTPITMAELLGIEKRNLPCLAFFDKKLATVTTLNIKLDWEHDEITRFLQDIVTIVDRFLGSDKANNSFAALRRALVNYKAKSKIIDLASRLNIFSVIRNNLKL